MSTGPGLITLAVIPRWASSVRFDRHRVGGPFLQVLGDGGRGVDLDAPGHARVVRRPVREGDVPACLGESASDPRTDPDGPADAGHQRDRPGRIEQRLLLNSRHKAQSFGLLRGNGNPIFLQRIHRS